MPEFFRVCLLNKHQHSRASYEQTLSISPGYATGPRSIAVLDAKGTMLMEVTPLPLFRTVAPWVVSGNPDVHTQLPHETPQECGSSVSGGQPGEQDFS